MIDFLKEPWPWYVAGPLIGLMVPILLLLANKPFGISSSLDHICAACIPARPSYFRYDWKSKTWNLMLVAGIVIGGVIGGLWLDNTRILISEATVTDLNALGIVDVRGYLPESIFSWENLFTFQGMIFMVVGGFLVGFGARYAGGCTSGHAITGLSNLQLPSLIAVVGFFLGGLVMTHLLLPYLLQTN
jgi:uncharacterized protein